MHRLQQRKRTSFSTRLPTSVLCLVSTLQRTSSSALGSRLLAYGRALLRAFCCSFDNLSYCPFVQVHRAGDLYRDQVRLNVRTALSRACHAARRWKRAPQLKEPASFPSPDGDALLPFARSFPSRRRSAC